jgi:hypothetical protein
MESLEFSEIAELVSKSRTVRLSPTPHSSSRDGWELYKGVYKVHLSETPFEVLYLQSRANAESMIDAKRRAFKPELTQVVFAPSLDARSTIHKKTFEGTAKIFKNSREYLASFIFDELREYQKKLQGLEPKHYVPPQLKVPQGSTWKIPNPLASFLSRLHTEPYGFREGGLGVLLAEPGQGKTFQSQHLVSQLAKPALQNTYFPIYVSAEQWHAMPSESLTSIWKTITNSFKYYESQIGWIDGNDALFVKTALKAGLFAVVFDGFDEYILRNKGKSTPIEVIRSLLNSVESTGAKLVITCRTTFWESEVTDFLNELNDSARKLCIYIQQPFDQNQARNYFRLRLDGHANSDRAANIFADLRKSNKSFAGRGFVLNLVADLVERGFNEPTVDTGTRPITWLIDALCQREQLRQDLALNASEQMRALQHFVSETIQGAAPDDDLLDMCIGIAAPNLDAPTRSECIRKLSSHPLISRAESGWHVCQEQVSISLLSSFIIEESMTKHPSHALKILNDKGHMEDSYIGDMALMMATICGRQLPDGKNVRNVIAALMNTQSTDGLGQPDGSVLGKLAVQLALKYVDMTHKSGSSHIDRRNAFQALMPDKQLNCLMLFDSIARMNFEGVRFINCRFDNVRWANCQFDSATEFDRCHFKGGSVQSSASLGSAKFSKINVDAEAKALIQSLQVTAGRRTYTADDLKADMIDIINKFSVKGGSAFKSVRKTYMDAGRIRLSKHKDAIISEMEKLIFETKSGSGRSEGRYELREVAMESARFLAVNNVLTGVLDKCFQSLKGKLKL